MGYPKPVFQLLLLHVDCPRGGTWGTVVPQRSVSQALDPHLLVVPHLLLFEHGSFTGAARGATQLSRWKRRSINERINAWRKALLRSR